MKFADIKVGQIVKHHCGFEAEVIEIRENKNNVERSDIKLKITNKGTQKREVGTTYTALPEYCTLLKDVKVGTNKNHKLGIDIEVNGLEKLAELTQLEKESTVFEAELGNGISFEGTKSDFEVFMKGVKEMMELALKLVNKSF